MAVKAETKFKVIVQAFLDTLPLCEHEKIQQVGKHGTLDIWATINSFSVLLELKATPKDKLSPIQKIKAMYHRRAGAFVFETYPGNWKEVKTKLTKIARFKHKSRPKL